MLAVSLLEMTITILHFLQRTFIRKLVVSARPLLEMLNCGFIILHYTNMRYVSGEDYKPPKDASSDESTCSSGVEEVESEGEEETDEESPKVLQNLLRVVTLLFLKFYLWLPVVFLIYMVSGSILVTTHDFSRISFRL